MTEKIESNLIERKIALFDSWISKLSKEGLVEEIDQAVVREVLEIVGANFEISESARLSLTRFRNLDRRQGMDSVWGRERIAGYRKWLLKYIKSYEEKTGKPLPVLEDSDTKTSGGLKFFTDLTAFAAGLMSFDDYKRITERRAEKGRLWQARREDAPIIPSKYSSFPPELPLAAWEEIKSRK